MEFDFRNITSYEHRLEHFEDSDIASRVDKDTAKRLVSKAKDCLKQIEAASSVWSVDGRKFLFVFSEINEDGLQKVTVWGLKTPGLYQRIKTVWVTCRDYIFEAVARFLTEYFELNLSPERYLTDAEWFYDIEDELKFRSANCPASLKPKLKLLRIWSDAMHRFNEMVCDLDFKILHKTYEATAAAADLDAQSMRETADSIYSDIDFHKEKDINLIGAAQMYRLAEIIIAREQKKYDRVIERGYSLESNTQALVKRLPREDFKGLDLIKVLNTIAYGASYSRLIHYDDLEKNIGKLLRLELEKSLDAKESMSLELLELMVNTRRFNKRLPKELSELLKDTLNFKVSSIGNFWDNMPVCGSLTGKLRKLWIQCMSLRLYGYDPNTSYTADELRPLIPEILDTKDAEAQLLFARIIYDSDFKRIRIEKFDEGVMHSVAPKSSQTDLLRRQAAILLWQAFEKKHPSTQDAAAPVNIGIQIPRETAQQPQPVRKDFQSREEVREWMEHMDHYESLRGQGVSLRDFCLVKGLPYEEFKQFYEETVADYEFLTSNPLMQGLARIPEDEQKEMASLFDRHMQKIDEICKGLSKLSGEKFDVSDYIGDKEKTERRIQEFSENIDNYRKKDVVETMKVVFNLDQLRKMEADMRDIIMRNGLGDKLN